MKCFTVEEQSDCILVTVDPHRGFRMTEEGADIVTEETPGTLSLDLQREMEGFLRRLPKAKIVCIDADGAVFSNMEKAGAFLPVICMLASAFAAMGFCVATLNPYINYGSFEVVMPKGDMVMGTVFTPKAYERQCHEKRS